MTKSIIFVLLGISFTPFCGAQKPKTTNAQVQELSAAGGLQSAINSIVQKQETPAWIGYRIPTLPKERTMCCFDSTNQLGNNGSKCCMGCKLESNGGGSFEGSVSDCAPPEPLRYAFLFLRVEGKQVQKVRTYSADCALDFANLPLYWLENVSPSQSVALLTNFALTANHEGMEYKKGLPAHAVRAIALHDDPSADQALEKLIQPGQPEATREHVAFWLGVERGKKGVEILRKYVKDDPNDHFREKAIFGFSQSKEPEALQELISIARNDPAAHVRGRAIFWLGQIGGRKEAEQITASIENDPETEVKKRAVFALAQMHNGEGVPLLIGVAKTNKNPVVRKEAIRWLGTTNDPRALDYLEQILTK
jgi:HEAT repeat protein